MPQEDNLPVEEHPSNLPLSNDATPSPLTADTLRAMVLDEVKALGFTLVNGSLIPVSDDKDFRRGLHSVARQIELEKADQWLTRAWRRYGDVFADGREVRPESVAPQLVLVEDQYHRDIFRLARYTWSLPYTKGYGRRIHYLVIDRAIGKLIGILGLQSPPLSFPARDRLFNYPKNRKTELVNQTMDIYTLGAVPPYNRLLGAKLIALAAASNEVRSHYETKYSSYTTRLEERQLPSTLVGLTTTSAFGRSSIYNRLGYRDIVEFRSLGFTEGYGAFHLERLYPAFREFLETQDISTRGGFGTGPRIKWQTMVRALNRIGLGSELLKHGVKREAFLIPLVNNLQEYMEGADRKPNHIDVTFEELSQFWKERWLVPRSDRVDGWHQWKTTDTECILFSHREKYAKNSQTSIR